MNSATTTRGLLALALALAGPATRAQPSQSPPVPDAVVDLKTADGASLLHGRWRYADAHIQDSVHRAPGSDNKPSGAPAPTHDIHPRINTQDFESTPWEDVPPAALEMRRTAGKLAFAWYRLDLTIPERVGRFSTAGATAILELVVDDYAEVWVDGRLPLVLGQSASPVIGGWNAPARIVVARDAHPGQQVHIAVFAANGPLADPPPNYVWIRSATLDFYTPERAMVNAPMPVSTEITRADPAMDGIVAPGAQAERLASGFSFVEGPVWVPPAPLGTSYGGGGAGGYLLFSDPNKNVIHRWDPLDGAVSIYRTKSGYTGAGGDDISAYHQPGSNGLALDHQGRLTICEHGNRRVTRLEPSGTITVIADRYDGKRLNSPNDLVYRSDDTLFFTDPPFGLPRAFDDPRKQLPFSGVYCIYNGVLRLAATDVTAPNGLAFTPDEKQLYVDNWDEQRKVILRYDVAPDGALSNRAVFADLTPITGETCLDGLKVDPRGNVYVSAPGGVRVYSERGTFLGTISIPELPANFAFGDADGRTLYMTARTGLYRLRLAPSAARP
jgi:gluconolactonase